MLTETQHQHFKTFGFVIMRQVFTSAELDRINNEFTHALEAAYRHAPFDGTKRHWVPMMGLSTPFFAGLLEDQRICAVAEQLYGPDTFAVIVDANRYVGNTGWHPDTGSIHQFGVKFAFYLEPVGPESGALRVIPGSHRSPLHDDLKQTMPKLGLPITEVPGYVCASEPGDVVAFDLRLWHASHGGSNDRRMCTCVYYNNPKTPEQDAATRKQAASNVKTTSVFSRPGEPIYDAHWLSNPENSPKRRQWIERLGAMGFLEPVEG